MAEPHVVVPWPARGELPLAAAAGVPRISQLVIGPAADGWRWRLLVPVVPVGLHGLPYLVAAGVGLRHGYFETLIRVCASFTTETETTVSGSPAAGD
jgi:hypothetical protein